LFTLEEPHYSVTFTCNITFLFCSCDAIPMKFDHEETCLMNYIHFPMAKVKSFWLAENKSDDHTKSKTLV